jgi:hypothetical protein
MKTFCLLAVLGLAACAGAHTFDQNLRGLEGRPVNEAFNVLGQPTGSYARGNTTFYVWQDNVRESVFGPAVSGGRGYRIGAPHGGSEFLWSGITYHSCVIRAATAEGMVQEITFEGDPGGCQYIHGRHRESWDKSPFQ